MALETGTFISDLVATNPTGSDLLSLADDHLRLIKGTIKSTFPNISGAVTKTHTQINTAVDQAGTAVQPSVMDAAIAAAIATAVASTKSALYPVGSIYVNAGVSTNPGTLLGFGTWAAFGVGRVMVGLNSEDILFDTLEETGGSKDSVVVSHTHSASSGPAGSHAHSLRTSSGISQSGGIGAVTTDANQFSAALLAGNTDVVLDHTHTVTVNTTGASGTNANVQPYVTVAMWKRTA